MLHQQILSLPQALNRCFVFGVGMPIPSSSWASDIFASRLIDIFIGTGG
jgi:hypothetical protein